MAEFVEELNKKHTCRVCGKEDYLYEELCKECNEYYTQGKQNTERRKAIDNFYKNVE